MLTDEMLNRLLAAAKSASEQAYCPYSHFRVGAAVLGGTGRIHAGCNIENASFGLTICAERAAMARAITDGETFLQAVVIFTPTPQPTAPCGACRQALNEFGPTMDCVCVCDGHERIVTTLAELLPRAFGPKNLQG